MKGSVRKPRTDGARGVTGSISASTIVGVDVSKRSAASARRRTQAALNEALADRQRGTYLPPSKTVRGFLDEWHEGARTELAHTAWTDYGQIVRRNINPYLGSKRLTDLSPIDVKRWHGKLLESGRRDGEGLSVASVKLVHRILRRALADAVRWNLIVTNPAAATRVPKGAAKELTVWSADEARRFLEGVADDRLVRLWTLALHTGLRWGELVGLRWRDIDLGAGTLTVAQRRTTANHQAVVTKPKAKSQRQLLLAPATVAALRTHLKRQREEWLALGPDRTDSGYVFVDEAGVEYHPYRSTKMCEDAVERTGVPKIRLHDTCTSFCAAGSIGQVL